MSPKCVTRGDRNREWEEIEKINIDTREFGIPIVINEDVSLAPFGENSKSKSQGRESIILHINQMQFQLNQDL